MIVLNQKLMLTYIYEPIVNFSQKPIAYEILTPPLASTDLADFSAEKFFSDLDKERKIEIFLDQIEEAKKYKDIFIRKKIKLNINIDDDHIDFLKSTPDLLTEISNLGFIAFEIHERCKKISKNDDEDFKVFRSYGIELWLDDLDIYKMCVNETNLTYFDGIKIDKHFYWHLLKMHEREMYFIKLIQGLRKLGKKIVVEGVENKFHFAFLLNKHVDGMQGYAWPSKRNME